MEEFWTHATIKLDLGESGEGLGVQDGQLGGPRPLKMEAQRDKIDLEIVSARIESEGWDCTLRNRLCCTFSGELADITLYPSGKLLVKSGERDVAASIAERHMQVWLAEF